jgi:hypothetical protein
MNQHEMKNFWKNPVVLLVTLGAGYWIYTYHFEHALGVLPYAILLLCPLMHIFMHGNHGHGGHQHDHTKTEEDKHAR